MKKQDIEYLDMWKKLKEAKTEKLKNKVISILVDKYYPLVEKISYKMAEKLQWNISPEELASLGVDGLYRAVERFSIEKGVSFSYYAKIRIEDRKSVV